MSLRQAFRLLVTSYSVPLGRLSVIGGLLFSVIQQRFHHLFSISSARFSIIDGHLFSASRQDFHHLFSFIQQRFHYLFSASRYTFQLWVAFYSVLSSKDFIIYSVTLNKLSSSIQLLAIKFLLASSDYTITFLFIYTDSSNRAFLSMLCMLMIWRTTFLNLLWIVACEYLPNILPQRLWAKIC